ncbi:radical SAM protein [Butyrivibrio sp. LC3010]|uniref:radical SAM protein n=1 Tax=Butyrivibrio sp. LC3010 TaxID=1280680 RepID=UPI0003F58E4E|nr:radical SAM protein [Butyrivibrio sp. LC3010]
MKSISIDDLKAKHVYIYGAGTYGSITKKILSENSIDVEGFIDSNATMIKSFQGKSVILPEQIPEIMDRVILVASLNHIQEMMDKLNSLNVKDYYSIDEVLDAGSYSDYFNEYEKEIIEKKERYKAKLSGLNSYKIIISNIDLVVTEYCNLSCHGCGSLMPLYKKPEHISLDEIMVPFDRYLDSIDELLELRILGGETFLYPDLAALLKHVINSEKIKKIIIFTNATIIPEDDVMELIANEKVSIHVANYGRVSKELDKLIAVCDENNIRYYVHDYLEWKDMGNLDFRDYDSKKLRELFMSCDNKNCSSFYRGKVYVCPRAAHGERLGYFKNREDEVIDFNIEKPIEMIRKKIRDMSRKNCYSACNYCSGNNIYNKTITAAQQINKELTWK